MNTQTGVIIRKAEPEDVDQIIFIEKQSFSDPWSRELLLTDISQPQSHYLVAVEGDQVLGYSGFWQVLDEGHIMNIAVDPAFRRKKIGARLLNEMMAEGNKLGIQYWTLEVRVSNTAAKALYEKQGFHSAGIRPGYYSDPKEDAEIYWLR